MVNGLAQRHQLDHWFRQLGTTELESTAAEKVNSHFRRYWASGGARELAETSKRSKGRWHAGNY
jgi:hypothetical protein